MASKQQNIYPPNPSNAYKRVEKAYQKAYDLVRNPAIIIPREFKAIVKATDLALKCFSELTDDEVKRIETIERLCLSLYRNKIQLTWSRDLIYLF